MLQRFLSFLTDFVSQWKLSTFIVLLVLIASALLLFLFRKKWDTRQVTFGAMCIALSFLLSMIRLYRMPQGGSVTPASMLPLMLYSYIFGPTCGIAAGVVYGLLQLLQDFYIMHPLSLIMDYILAFAMLGLAGFAKKRFPLGVLLAGLGRWFWHALSGYLFYSMYVWEGWNPIVYTLIYNFLVVGPDLILCFIVSLLPGIRRLANDARAKYRKTL